MELLGAEVLVAVEVVQPILELQALVAVLP